MSKAINSLSSRLVKKEEMVPAASTTKKCSYCCSEIPLEAVRCAHCTSMLEES